MPLTATMFRAAKPSSRFFISPQAQGKFCFGAFRQRFQHSSRRWQSTAAAPEQTSWVKKMWDSPVGIKTVHFWAPVMKWALVLAGIGDLYRPAEKLSLTQNLALTGTGAIWTRWCFIIKPRNILLATVNFFLGTIGVIQVCRIVTYNMNNRPISLDNQLETAKEEVKDVASVGRVNIEKKAKS